MKTWFALDTHGHTVAGGTFSTLENLLMQHGVIAKQKGAPDAVSLLGCLAGTERIYIEESKNIDNKAPIDLSPIEREHYRILYSYKKGVQLDGGIKWYHEEMGA